MSLSSHPVHASVAVSDMTRARRFYEEALGLAAAAEQGDESRIYTCGGCTSLHVYPSPASAGKTPGTMATWHVTDLERIVDELAANGVSFEQYHDPPMDTDERGIQATPDGKVAWFCDPDGNTFAIEQTPANRSVTSAGAMADHEQQIRALIEGWAEAVHNSDMSGVLAHHADDIVMFDVPPPQEGVRGIDAYRETWPPFFQWQEQGASFEIVSLEITASDDVAYAHALLRCGTQRELAEHPEIRLRLTLGLHKRHGRWVVAHEHHSFRTPTRPAEGVR